MSAFEVSRLGFRAVEPSASVATPRLALARRSFRVWRGEFSAARGDAFSAGDIDHAFSIQSVSKPFVAVLARGKALRSGSGDSWVDIQAGAVSLAFGLTAVRDGTPVPAAVPPGTDHSWREKRRTRSSKKQETIGRIAAKQVRPPWHPYPSIQQRVPSMASVSQRPFTCCWHINSRQTKLFEAIPRSRPSRQSRSQESKSSGVRPASEQWVASHIQA